MKKKTFRDEPAEWWLEFALAPFNLAQGRNAVWRILAMTLGCFWTALMLALGLPVLLFDVGRDIFRELGKPK